MQRRIGTLIATMVLIIVTSAYRTLRPSEYEDAKKAAVDVVLAYELAVQTYDFDKLDSLNTAEARLIDGGYPQLLEPGERRAFQQYKDASMRIDYHPQDAVAQVQGNFAWVTITLHSVWKADTAAGRAMLGGSEWHGTYVESFILVKTPAGWKIAFHHTSSLPSDFGVEPDYQQDRGGMKFAEVSQGGAAEKAGFKSGDVLIEYGGRKIDNPVDYDRLRYAYYEGEKVKVTVIRGAEKITKKVTLEAMK
jgi:PDZ domain/SnoaL-like domain